MSDIPPPAASPVPPDDSAPLNLEKTPAHGVVTVPLLVRKLAQAEARMAMVAEEASARGVKKESNGKPVIPKGAAPWLLAGFTLCGSVTTVAMSYEGAIPRWLLIMAAIGSMTFGGLLASSSGLRR